MGYCDILLWHEAGGDIKCKKGLYKTIYLIQISKKGFYDVPNYFHG